MEDKLNSSDTEILMKEISVCEEALEILKQGKDGEHVEDILGEMGLSFDEALQFYRDKKENLEKYIRSDPQKKSENDILKSIRGFDPYVDLDLESFISLIRSAVKFNRNKTIIHTIFYSLSTYLNNFYDSRQQSCRTLLKIYVSEWQSLVPLSENSLMINLSQTIANSAVKLAIKTQMKEDELQALKLVPEKISVDALGFNLARLFAQKKEKANVLKYSGLALYLGVNIQSFHEDSLLSPYKKDLIVLHKDR